MRLTEKNDDHYIARQDRVNGKIIGNQMCLDKLGELEDAEEQGLLLRLPCKVGEKIYYSSKTCGVMTFIIVKIEIYEDEILFVDDCENIWEEKEFGETVFLTREEAESALAEKEKAR